MLNPSRLQDLLNRSNPTEGEKKELNAHFSEFQEELVNLQESYGLAIIPQISVEPIGKKSPIIVP